MRVVDNDSQEWFYKQVYFITIEITEIEHNTILPFKRPVKVSKL